LAAFSELKVLVLLLRPPNSSCDRLGNAAVMRRMTNILDIGVDDVLTDPPRDADALQQAIAVARMTAEVNRHRTRQIWEKHQSLLWNAFPQALLPRMRPVDEHMSETSSRVGTFQLVRKLATVRGTVFQALGTQDGSHVAIKVMAKSDIIHACELEGIYREYVFLTRTLKHRNIARGLDLLHSSSKLYFLTEFCGQLNLAQELAGRPEQRFAEADALDVLDQVSAAMEYCHQKAVAHRSLSPQHVVLEEGCLETVHGRFLCRVVDFCTAIAARSGVTSATVCGCMPCIAPEISSGEKYSPQPADIWSVGVILVEMVSGQGAMCSAVNANAQMKLAQAGQQVRSYFLEPGSLSKVFSQRASPVILHKAEAMLQVDPQKRKPMGFIRQRQ